MKKTLCFLGLILLLIMSLVSCGRPAETTCDHDMAQVKCVEATCTSAGVTDYECTKCGEKQTVETPALAHNYAKDGDEYVCSGCGDKAILVPAGQTVSAKYYCEGNISFTLQSAGEVNLAMLVDGKQVAAYTEAGNCDGETAISAGVHFLGFTNTSNQDVYVGKMTMNGEKLKENSILLETTKATGDYASFNVYVKTSDPSGNYYVRYMFQYEYNDTRNKYAGNSTTNVDNFRIKTAQLVKVTGKSATSVQWTKVYDVLQQGEISLAMRQNNVNNNITTEAQNYIDDQKMTYSGDFIGGYHGDERIKSVALCADGLPIDVDNFSVASVMECSVLTFKQTTTLYEWGTSSAGTYGVPAAEHSQSFVITGNGIKNRQELTWIADDFELGTTYLQMFTMMRVSGGRTICDLLETYDENGNLVAKATVEPMSGGSNKVYVSNIRNRSVKYGSATSGISGEAGFVIVEGIKVESAQVAARVSQGDNKWYVAFKSAENGNHPKAGEHWAWDVYYTIDYVQP